MRPVVSDDDPQFLFDVFEILVLHEHHMMLLNAHLFHMKKSASRFLHHRVTRSIFNLHERVAVRLVKNRENTTVIVIVKD